MPVERGFYVPEDEHISELFVREMERLDMACQPGRMIGQSIQIVGGPPAGASVTYGSAQRFQYPRITTIPVNSLWLTIDLPATPYKLERATASMARKIHARWGAGRVWFMDSPLHVVRDDGMAVKLNLRDDGATIRLRTVYYHEEAAGHKTEFSEVTDQVGTHNEHGEICP